MLVRDLLKIFLVGIVLLSSHCVYANTYKVVVLPDNIVTENIAVDSFIYNGTSEFFANDIINILNQTDFIKSPVISSERKLLKSIPNIQYNTKLLTNKFKTTYNIDFELAKKIAKLNQTSYIALLTSNIDAENYILRRTIWDFLNIPGATVIDPAYKINTYVVLLDVDNNIILWSKTFQKTISVIEGRIITRGVSPQTEQLNKIKDYSSMICPEIAQNIQIKVLPSDIYAKESRQIYYDLANFENNFTKKYRRWRNEGKKDYNKSKTYIQDNLNKAKQNFKNQKQVYSQKNTIKEPRLEYKKDTKIDIINTEKKTDTIKKQNRVQNNSVQNIDFYKKYDKDIESAYKPINIKYKKKNNLIEKTETEKPNLRNYN